VISLKKVKEITGKFTPRLGGLKSEGGRNTTDSSGIKARWKEYIENLYKRNETVTEFFKEVAYQKSTPSS